MQKVIFRKANGEVLAILPNNPANVGFISCYAHIGQHSECSIFYTRVGRLATPDEYAPLLRELTAIGYNLKVCKRVQYDDLQRAWGRK